MWAPFRIAGLIVPDGLPLAPALASVQLYDVKVQPDGRISWMSVTALTAASVSWLPVAATPAVAVVIE